MLIELLKFIEEIINRVSEKYIANSKLENNMKLCGFDSALFSWTLMLISSAFDVAVASKIL